MSSSFEGFYSLGSETTPFAIHLGPSCDHDFSFMVNETNFSENIRSLSGIQKLLFFIDFATKNNSQIPHSFQQFEIVNNVIPLFSVVT